MVKDLVGDTLMHQQGQGPLRIVGADLHTPDSEPAAPPPLTPEQIAWLAHKADLQAQRAPKGRLATLISAAQRLQGRTPTEREVKRQAAKEFKRRQKRMELLTKDRYPTPKRQKPSRRRRMF